MENAVTGQLVEEAESLKTLLKVRFGGKPVGYVDAVIRVAHALLAAEAEAEQANEMAALADRTLAKLSGRSV